MAVPMFWLAASFLVVACGTEIHVHEDCVFIILFLICLTIFLNNLFGNENNFMFGENND